MDMMDSIECLSSLDGMDEDDVVSSSHLPRPFFKTSAAAVVVASIRVFPNGGGGPVAVGAGGGIPGPLMSPTTSVHELLECPVCTNSMYPPIHQVSARLGKNGILHISIGTNVIFEFLLTFRYLLLNLQCQNGHTICSTCKARVHNRCPTCRQELGDIRCLALEKVAESLELPCKYYSLGCPEIFPYYSKLKHESQCTFRPYNCPYAGSECSIPGDIPFLVSHLRDHHKVDMHSGCTFNHRYVKSNPREVENATWMLTVFHCFGQYFCLHFEAFQLGMVPVYMAFLRLMGDENEARNYSYSLEVGANGRKMVWEGNPRSIRDSHRKVRDSHDGLIIQRNMALFFSGGDRKELKLRVTGRIWKEQQNPDSGACIPNLFS
ncbi:E3 ubiquitin-protein ligase SINAT3 [Dichanthelium oligosanthes]|uniref:RING-type E3 ubiquitin transferase n=1 Tax=Dichanthelium oligosanthes TaxID=888268 RepID=A0A1E5UPA1_9POAL|nr:E3 ubiquitin-protein ligase SINAT3 [Dichanthelium oligosanthes]